MRISVKAAAKINLMLDIIERLPNGYHSLWMVMQSVSLYDTVTIERTGTGEIALSCSDSRLPSDETNLAFKAARTFFEATGAVNDGISISIEKRIPFAAGLAGGSADAAATLLGLDRLYGTALKPRALNKIGLTLGADVPFCLQGGTMLAQHIGELLTPVPELPDCFIVLAKPSQGISTAEAYRLCDAAANLRAPDKRGMLNALLAEDLKCAAKLVGNVFEQVIDVPERVSIKAMMREHGALGCCMSGSGPTVFGLFEEEQQALACAESIRPIVPEVFVCRPVEEGCTI
ncbi:MAG TPA: 4-(cytidine 5'-diphospho)-2-C-methyl-D-erythritol kinase [Candidatus Fimivicinus intestinavium]|nr:4-(cytidine 5'-diphospho)-2-C-methyl-D-erythritol kinase [Candidatus Fimivicinus intestinavium]